MVLPTRRPGAGLVKAKIHRERPHPRDRMAVGFFFGNTELSLELWTVIAGVSVLMTNPSGTNGTAGIIGSIISNRSHLCYSSM